MSVRAYRESLMHRCSELNKDIADLEQQAINTTGAQHVAAMGELDVLKRLRTEITEKLADLGRESRSSWRDLCSSIDEEVDDAVYPVERWIARH